MNAMGGRTLPIYGDGKNIRDWLYVEGHCRGINAVLSQRTPGETYNIGGCNKWTNVDIVKCVCRALDELRPGANPRETRITYVKDRPGHDRRYAIDSGKLMQSLGRAPEQRFEDGIVKTVERDL